MTDTSLEETTGVKLLGMCVIVFCMRRYEGEAFLVAGFEFLHPDLCTARTV